MNTTKNKIKTLVCYFLVCFHVALIVAPFLWLIYSSLKTNKEFIASVWALPKVLQFSNYVEAWGSGALGTYTLNSVIVTSISVFITVLIATLAGYAMGIFRHIKWMSKVQIILVVMMTIPAHVSLIPLVETMRNIGLLDTRFGVVLAEVAFNIPMSVFILFSFFVTLPYDIIEAAKFDGAKESVIFSKIALPLAMPAMFTTAIINMIWNWNDFLFPLVFINNPKLKTLPIGLKDYVGEHVTNFPVMMAAIFIASLGALIIYGIFQKQVIGGLMGGAVKE